MNVHNVGKTILGGILVIVPLLYFPLSISSPMIQVDRELPEYAMLDPKGEKVFIKEITNGKQSIVYFGYLKCKTICLSSIIRLQEVLEKKKSFQLIFISLDPENDQPHHLKTLFTKSEQRVILLRTTTQKEAFELAGILGIQANQGNGSEDINHQNSLIWIGPENRIKGIFPEFGDSWDKNPSEFLELLSSAKEGENNEY